MLSKNIKVLRPEKTKVIKQRLCCYVYYVLDSIYDPNKQFNTDKRVCIGKLVSEDKDCKYMYPNEMYFKYFGPEDVEPEFSDTLQIGSVITFTKIMNNLGLDDILRDIHKDDFAKIVDLINYIIIGETATMQHFPTYAWNHFVLSKHVYDDTTISRLFSKGITSEQIEEFLDKWNKKKCSEKIYISYDSTNINNSGEGIDYVEEGHAKDNKDKPQINLSYAIDHNDATPLFYELYPGSIIDNSQLRYMIKKLKMYGYENVGVIVDRGYFSAENIRDFTKNNIDFLLMVKMNAKFIQDNFNKARSSLVYGSDCFISKYQIFGKTIKASLSSKDNKKRYLHYYYDNLKAQEEKNAFLTNIADLEKELEIKKEEKICKQDKLNSYTKYFNLKFDASGLFIDYSRNSKAITEEMKDYGFFAMVSSKEMTSLEALDLYRKRDSVEKLFRVLKTSFDFDNVKVKSKISLESKIHIIFLASIIRNEFFNKLETIKGEDKKNYTVPAAIRELEKVVITKGADGKYYRKYGLTKKQRLILESVGVTNKYIEKIVELINE